jgi:hypothetical protein
MEIYFDGYCPESMLKDKQVEMRLNEDDFWESESTGLQIAVNPPFATILRWRGKGNIRKSSNTASNTLVGLVMTAAKKEDGQEILPDEENIINNKLELEWYLTGIYDSKEEFDAAKFNPNDPAFEKQEKHLEKIKKENFHRLVELFENMKQEVKEKSIMENRLFYEFHQMLYDLEIIFNFNWMAWQKGWKEIHDTKTDFSNCSLLKISMYLTAIFRADRFCDGVIDENFKNKTLDKIFERLKSKTPCH